jgi:hypothetical protein
VESIRVLLLWAMAFLVLAVSSAAQSQKPPALDQRALMQSVVQTALELSAAEILRRAHAAASFAQLDDRGL